MFTAVSACEAVILTAKTDNIGAISLKMIIAKIRVASAFMLTATIHKISAISQAIYLASLRPPF